MWYPCTFFKRFVCIWKAELQKGKNQRERERDREKKKLRTAGLFRKWPKWQSLGQAEVRSVELYPLFPHEWKGCKHMCLVLLLYNASAAYWQGPGLKAKHALAPVFWYGMLAAHVVAQCVEPQCLLFTVYFELCVCICILRQILPQTFALSLYFCFLSVYLFFFLIIYFTCLCNINRIFFLNRRY